MPLRASLSWVTSQGLQITFHRCQHLLKFTSMMWWAMHRSGTSCGTRLRVVDFYQESAARRSAWPQNKLRVRSCLVTCSAWADRRARYKLEVGSSKWYRPLTGHHADARIWELVTAITILVHTLWLGLFTRNRLPLCTLMLCGWSSIGKTRITYVTYQVPSLSQESDSSLHGARFLLLD